MTESRKRHLAQVAARRQFDLTVVLENIWDPHNVAAILRSCDAVGVQEIHLVYTKEKKFPRIGAKAAAGVKKMADDFPPPNHCRLLPETASRGLYHLCQRLG